ncbi:MAG: acyltransferase family protein [Dehalococcoidia bacterium]
MQRAQNGRPDRYRLPYQPALDGIRGLAVAAVLAYHAGLPWARGGFLGVDAFFVLSGYLITSLLVTEWRATGSISLAAFWARRARRLLPALFLLLAGVACYAVVFAQPEELARIRVDAFATLAYVANWQAVFSGESYFEQFSVPSPLQHTWSLAIEEQWYAVWPAVVMVLLRLRRGSLGTLLGAACVLAAGSSLLMGFLYDPHGDPSRVYYGTDTRAQSLLVGAVLATWLTRRGPAALQGKALLLQLAGIACGGYIAWMWLTTSYDSFFLYRGGLLLLALAVAVVIAAAVHPKGGPLTKMLSARPLRDLGLVSYGVYLWHWPVYLVLTPERTGWEGYDLFAARVLLTLAIATASYHLFETPFRRGAFRKWRISWALAPAAVAVLVMGLVLVTRGGEPSFVLSTSSSPPGSAEVPAGLSAGGPMASARPIRVLVAGDSVAVTMAQGLARAGPTWNLSVWNQGRLGCGVLRGDAVVVQGRRTELGDCNDWPAKWQSYVDVFRPDVAIVLAGAWDLYDREVDGRLLEFGTPEADTFVLSELDEAVDVLSSRGAQVILLTTPYYQPRDLALAEPGPRFDRLRIAQLNSLYQQLAQRRQGVVSIFDLNGLMSSAAERGSGMDNRETSPDGVHFAPAGADLVAQRLAPSIRQAALPGRSSLVEGAPSPQQGGEELPSRWLELLSQVPDTSEARSWTTMNDYARFRDAFGVALPATDAGERALFDYYQRLLFNDNGQSMALAPADLTGIATFPPRLAETRTQLGFSIAEVDQDVWGGEYPIRVLRGRFDQARIDEAIRAHGGSCTGGGGIGETSRPGYTLVRGDYVYCSSTPEDLAAMLDAAAGERPSLADVPDFQLLARGLERLGTYTALFSVDRESYSVEEIAKGLAGPDAGEQRLESIRDGLQRETKLLPYDAFATGAGVDARGPYTAVVLLNADEPAARANMWRLQGRIDEGTSWVSGQPFREFIDGVDISSEGRLVLAKLYTNAYRLWFTLQAHKDTLLLHE